MDNSIEFVAHDITRVVLCDPIRRRGTAGWVDIQFFRGDKQVCEITAFAPIIEGSEGGKPPTTRFPDHDRTMVELVERMAVRSLPPDIYDKWVEVKEAMVQSGSLVPVHPAEGGTT